MPETPEPTSPLEAPDAAAWVRALLTLDLALEACRATGAQGKPAPTLERMAPRGVPRRLWRTCVALGVADLWQRLGPGRRRACAPT